MKQKLQMMQEQLAVLPSDLMTEGQRLPQLIKFGKIHHILVT